MRQKCRGVSPYDIALYYGQITSYLYKNLTPTFFIIFLNYLLHCSGNKASFGVLWCAKCSWGSLNYFLTFLSH
jgi:hypothetical protein